MTIRRHLVLDAGPHDHLLDVVEANLTDPGVTGIEFHLDDITTPDHTLTHYAFLDDAGQVRVTLVADTDTPAQYLVLEAEDATTADHLAESLAPNLAALPLDRLREAAEANLGEEPGHLIRLALGAPPTADPATVSLLTKALASDDHDTRLAALEAAALTQWREVEQPLADAGDREQDPELKRYAAECLDSLRLNMNS